MILFVADQVAGAEYLLPLLRRWSSHAPEPWHLIAGPRACPVLERAGIKHEAMSVPTAARAVDELKAIQPRVGVMSSSGDSTLERVFRSALRQLDKPCYQYVDMWANYALRFRSGEAGAPLDLPDAVLTIDENARTAMISDGIPRKLIHVIGQPYFEERRRELQKQASGRSWPRRVLLATQPIARYHGRSLGYDEHDFLRCCLEAWQQSGADWQRLDIAAHPDEPRDAHGGTIAGYSEHIRMVENPVAQIGAYAAVLSAFSSLLVHALLAATAAASVQPGAVGADICHLSSQGLIPRFTHVAQLAEWLDNTIDLAPLSTLNSSQSAAIIDSLAGSCDRFEHFLLEHRI